MLFKFPDWMWYYLEYLPYCIEGYPYDGKGYSANQIKQVKAIEKYMNMHPDDEDYEEHEYIIDVVRHTTNLLIELRSGGELIPPGTEYV